ncbi:MAG: topology modulation protein [Oscillospiraceae bacterium]|nr:topology modulation protein [Oscillospiraceae bacterium]
MININDYTKIILIGSGGSGKSTFAKQLGGVTGLPVIHLDNEFWRPGWVETPRDEWVEKQKQLISGEKWIIDGNYGGTLEMRFVAADLVIFLDINPVICVWSAARRTGKKRSDLPQELTEPKIFSKDFREFAKWIWNYPKTGRNKVIALHERYPDKAFLQIKSRRELKKYLKVKRNNG